VLRQIFLKADIGISGVNFGVIDNGAICLLTNEGNGRNVTTLPSIHIAIMGIERLVPTMDNLATMLYLLPRSATGQKLTVYTSLILSPRRTGEVDGPKERHLVLLDNGRRRLQHSPLAEILYCIRCGTCLNICPVFREIGGHAYVNREGKYAIYPGPVGSVLTTGLFGQAEFGHLARASSLCGACKEACPVDIDLPKLLLRIRAGETGRDSAKPNPPWYVKFGLYLFARIATLPRLYRFAQYSAGIMAKLAAPKSSWLRLPSFTGWGYSKDFPRPALRPFSAHWSVRNPVPADIVPLQELVITPKPSSYAFEEDWIEQFAKELAGAGGWFIRTSKEDLVEAIEKLMLEEKQGCIHTWNEDQLPAGLLVELKHKGVSFSEEPDPSAVFGLTGALAGIAETGSVVITAGHGRPLTASMLPEVHIVVLDTNRIVATIPEALRMKELSESSSAVLITGPSRTADIEMTLTIGVHGPTKLFVLGFS
jgi:L-lactate dehydrogenase complex protein LldF